MENSLNSAGPGNELNVTTKWRMSEDVLEGYHGT